MRFDRMTIMQVFLFWVAVIIVFGVAYLLVNSGRGALVYARADIAKVMTKVEESGLRKREVADLWTFANFFEQRINEVVELFSHRQQSRFTSDIDVIDTKLLANSLVQSVVRTEELLEELDKHGVDWRREVTVFAFSGACKSAAHALETMRHEQESGAIKQDIELFEKSYEGIKRRLER